MPSPSLYAVAASLSIFGAAMRWAFDTREGASARMRLLASSGIAAASLDLVLIATSNPHSASAEAMATTLVGVSQWLFWWAWRTNRSQPLTLAFSPGAPTHLVRRGPYRHIRHPIYDSYELTWIAASVAAGWSWPTVLTALVMGTQYVLAARHEEAKFRASALGSDHRAYCGATGMFLPRWPRRAIESPLISRTR